MAKERIQARVDDTRKRAVEAYADEHDITQAEAVRRLVGRGVDYEEGHLAATDGMGTPATLGDVRAAAQGIKMLLLSCTAMVSLVVGAFASALGHWLVSGYALLVVVFCTVLVLGKMHSGGARWLVGKLPGHHRRPPLDELEYSNGDPVISGGDD